MQHGACLGLGLAALGTGDPEIFEEVKSIVFQDSAVAGEGAGIGIGLLHAGTAPEFAEELLMMMRETQHEKVIAIPLLKYFRSLIPCTLCSEQGALN